MHKKDYQFPVKHLNAVNFIQHMLLKESISFPMHCQNLWGCYNRIIVFQHSQNHIVKYEGKKKTEFPWGICYDFSESLLKVFFPFSRRKRKHFELFDKLQILQKWNVRGKCMCMDRKCMQLDFSKKQNFNLLFLFLFIYFWRYMLVW